jgi:hypothetical protein
MAFSLCPGCADLTLAMAGNAPEDRLDEAGARPWYVRSVPAYRATPRRASNL